MTKKDFIVLIKKSLNFESLEHSIETNGKFLVSNLDSERGLILGALKKMFHDNKNLLTGWEIDVKSISVGFTSFNVREVNK